MNSELPVMPVADEVSCGSCVYVSSLNMGSCYAAWCRSSLSDELSPNKSKTEPKMRRYYGLSDSLCLYPTVTQLGRCSPSLLKYKYFTTPELFVSQSYIRKNYVRQFFLFHLVTQAKNFCLNYILVTFLSKGMFCSNCLRTFSRLLFRIVHKFAFMHNFQNRKTALFSPNVLTNLEEW